MANQKITFDFKGKHYILEFNRASVRQMERNGFSLDRLGDAPLTTMTELFAGAFLKNHRHVYGNRDLVEEMISKMKNKDKLFSRLIDMYREPTSILFDEPDETAEAEDSEGNIDWGE